MPTLVNTTSSPGAPLSTVPALDVEVAFTSAPSDGPSWRSIADGRIKSLHTKRGRPHELDRFAPGTFEASVGNRDARYNPGNTASPLVNLIRPGKRIRTLLTWNGVRYPLIGGTVDGFPQSYGDAGDNWIDLSAKDVFKRLARNVIPNSLYQLIISTDRPWHWWRLDDGPDIYLDNGFGPTVVLTTQNGVVDSASSIVPYDGGHPGVTSAGGYILADGVVNTDNFNVFSWEFWFQMPPGDLPADTAVHPLAYASYATDASESRLQVHMYGASSGSAGKIEVAHRRFDTGATDTIISTERYDDDHPHHGVVTYDDTGVVTLMIDGAVIGATAASTDFFFFTASTITYQLRILTGFFTSGRTTWEGTLSHFLIWDHVLTATDALRHYRAGFDGLTEPSGVRATRILDYVGIPPTARVIQTGSSDVGGHDLPGGNALDYLQKLAESEAGQFLADDNDDVLWRQRHDLLTATRSLVSQATFSNSAHGLATISFVAAGALTETTSTGAVAIALPAGWQAGDLLMIVAEFNGAPTISASAGWTLRATRNHNQNSRTLQTYYRVAQAGDTDPTLTSNNAAGWIGTVVAYRDVDQADPFAVASASVGDSAVGTFANFQPGSVVTDTDNALVLSIIGTDDDNALALLAGSENGFTANVGGAAYDGTVPTIDESIGVASKLAPSAGAFTAPTWDLPVNGPDRFVYITDALNAGPATVLPYVGIEVPFDEDQTRNPTTVTRQGGAPQVAIDVAAIERNGFSAWSRSGQLYANDNQSFSATNWYLTHYKDPAARISAIVIQPQMAPATMWPIILALKIGDRVTVVESPRNSTSITRDYIVEAIEHDWDRDTPWTVTLRFSPIETLKYWLLGDQTLSVLGQTTRVAF